MREHLQTTLQRLACCSKIYPTLGNLTAFELQEPPRIRETHLVEYADESADARRDLQIGFETSHAGAYPARMERDDRDAPVAQGIDRLLTTALSAVLLER